MRRKLIAIIAMLAAGMMLFASGPQEAPAAGDGPIELKFWSLFTGGDGEFFDAMIEEFNSSQDEIHMTNDMVKFDDYYTKLTTALAAGTAPDVIVLHQARLINYVPSGVLLPLDGYVSEEMLADFQTAPLEACRMDGEDGSACGKVPARFSEPGILYSPDGAHADPRPRSGTRG